MTPSPNPDSNKVQTVPEPPAETKDNQDTSSAVLIFGNGSGTVGEGSSQTTQNQGSTAIEKPISIPDEKDTQGSVSDKVNPITLSGETTAGKTQNSSQGDHGKIDPEEPIRVTIKEDASGLKIVDIRSGAIQLAEQMAQQSGNSSASDAQKNPEGKRGQDQGLDATDATGAFVTLPPDIGEARLKSGAISGESNQTSSENSGGDASTASTGPGSRKTRNLVKYPYFSIQYPARRLNRPGDPGILAEPAGILVWPLPEGNANGSPFAQMFSD